MRIRKLIAQKKISATNSSSSSSSSTPSSCSAAVATTTTPTFCEEERVNNYSSQKPLICELSMSPWDVIPVEKLLGFCPDEEYERQVLKTEEGEDEEEEDNDDSNDKITDESVNAEEDQISIEENDIESEEEDEETEEDQLEEKLKNTKLGLKSVTKNNQKRKRDNHDTDDYGEKKKKKKKIVVYCCKKDGKGWHCRSKAQIGNPLCEHHMIQMQGYIHHQRDTYHHRKIRKLDEKKTTARRGRTPKELSSTNTTIRGTRNKDKLSAKKSSEFYYYSGFGPVWGKSKRGRPPNEVKKEEEDAEEEALTRQVIIDEALVRLRSPSPIMKTVKEEENDNSCMFVDDDFDDTTDEDDTNGVNGTKKRYRKPIKARSLKSLF